MAWRHRYEAQRLGFFFFFRNGTWRIERSLFPLDGFADKGRKEGSARLCVCSRVLPWWVDMSVCQVVWCLPFFFCTRVLFSSQVGFLWLFKIIWRFRPGIFVFRAVGRMRGWRGLSWCWEGLLSKKKRKGKWTMPMCADKNENQFLPLSFLSWFLFLFSEMGLGYRAGEIMGMQQVRRRRSSWSWGARLILTRSFHLKY